MQSGDEEGDHLMPIGGDLDGPSFEGWTLLAALAAQTSRLRLGLMVTRNRFRPPAMLAKIATTVDVVSGGRLDFRIGAGSRPSVPIVRREYAAHDCPNTMPLTRSRVSPRRAPSCGGSGPTTRRPTSTATTSDPTRRCTALAGPYTGLWRLRVGDYRLIPDIRRRELVINALDVGNRRSIYD